MQDSRPKNLQNVLSQDYNFQLGNYISEGWELFKKNAGLMVAYTVVFILIAGGVGIVDGILAGAMNPEAVDPNAPAWASQAKTSGITALYNLLLRVPLEAGFYVVAFKGLKQQSPAFGDFFKGFQSFAQLVIAGILFSIFTFIGFILCLIPGIYLAVSYILFPLLIIDRRLGFWEALETSRKIIGKNWFSWLGLGVVLFFINCAGVLACCVGLLVTIPLTYCVWTVAYNDIVGVERTSF